MDDETFAKLADSAKNHALANECNRLRAENEELQSCACSDCNREILSLREQIAGLGYLHDAALLAKDRRIAELEALEDAVTDDRDYWKRVALGGREG